MLGFPVRHPLLVKVNFNVLDAWRHGASEKDLLLHVETFFNESVLFPCWFGSRVKVLLSISQHPVQVVRIVINRAAYFCMGQCSITSQVLQGAGRNIQEFLNLIRFQPLSSWQRGIVLYDGLYGKKQVFLKFLQIAQGYELIPVDPIGWL